jgi:hypothetical protein
MSENETISDQSRCGIRIQVDPPSNLPSGNIHRPSNYPSFTSFPAESVRNNDQESVAQLEVPTTHLIENTNLNDKRIS